MTTITGTANRGRLRYQSSHFTRKKDCWELTVLWPVRSTTPLTPSFWHLHLDHNNQAVDRRRPRRPLPTSRLVHPPQRLLKLADQRRMHFPPRQSPAKSGINKESHFEKESFSANEMSNAPKREIETLAIFSPPRMMISLTVYEFTKKKKRRFELNTKRSQEISITPIKRSLRSLINKNPSSSR